MRQWILSVLAVAAIGLSGCAGYGVVSQAGGYCSSLASASCAQGSFCQLTDGQCNFANVGGTCVARPQSCSGAAEPVCGCDNQTYQNRCEATRAGVSIKYTGGCFERQPAQN